MEKEAEINRRTFLTIASAGAFVSSPRSVHAQTVVIPSLSETISLLEADRGASEIWVNYRLAKQLGTSATFLIDPESALADVKENIRGGFEWPDDQLLSKIFDDAIRSQYRDELAEKGDPLELIRMAHEEMLNSFTEAVTKFGLSPDLDDFRSAIESLTTIERIAAVDSDVEMNEPFLCRVYPFSWFC